MSCRVSSQLSELEGQPAASAASESETPDERVRDQREKIFSTHPPYTSRTLVMYLVTALDPPAVMRSGG